MNKHNFRVKKQTYIPKNEEILSWDPENMEKYWQQCRQFDYLSPLEEGESELLSREGFSNLF